MPVAHVWRTEVRVVAVLSNKVIATIPARPSLPENKIMKLALNYSKSITGSTHLTLYDLMDSSFWFDAINL